jgi:serine/threonine-protein kinase
VAVKVLRPEHTGNEVTEARFRREATTAARLRHANIVTIRDIGRSDGVTWVVMDLIPGSLSRRLQVLPALPEADVVRLGLDVAAALATAHAAGIIHRDIKPDNILIGSAGEGIVCDFGLARALESGADLSATNQVVGTPHYFSPEQARGEPLDGRSDLYALGVTLYRAATGQLPFAGNDWYAVARRHVEEPAPDPRTLVPGLSAGFADIVLRLLAKKPDARFRSAEELYDRLSQLPSAPTTGARLALGGGGTTAVHPVFGTALRWWQSRLLLAAAAAAVIAAVLWLGRGQPTPGTVWARVSSTTAPPPAPLGSLLDPGPADSGTVRAVPVDTPASSDLKPQAPPSVRTGALLLDASAGTEATLNGRPLAELPWQDLKARPGRYIVEARLVEGAGIVECPYSRRTDTLQLRPGARLEHHLDLARCTRLSVDIAPPDAQLSFTDSLGATVAYGAVKLSEPIQLRSGIWRVRAQAPRCAAFDAMDTLRAGSDTMKIVMIC